MARRFAGVVLAEWSKWNWRKHWFYMLAQSATLIFILWSLPSKHTPATGTAIAVLAALAAIMSVQPEIGPRHKFVYFALMAALLTAEFRAIRNDRVTAENEQKQINMDQNTRLRELLEGERENTQKLIDSENKSFNSVLQQDQKEFAHTLSVITGTHNQDEKEFEKVVQQGSKMIESEREMSEIFAGRLVPGNTPTPPNACDEAVSDHLLAITPNTTLLLFPDNNVQLVDTVPYTVVRVGSRDVIAFDHNPYGPEIYLSVDFRDENNKIMVRIDKNGIFNPRGLNVLRPDKSTLLIEDSYGNDFFRATFLNPHAFQVSGKIIYCGKPADIGKIYSFHVSNSCMGEADTNLYNGLDPAAITVSAPSCPSAP